MNWTFAIKNRLLASAVLLSLCLLVLASHYLDRRHTEKVKSSISTMYEDRLVAETYIFRMTTAIYEVREILASDASLEAKSSAVEKHMNELNSTYDIYSKTRLTKTEDAAATELINYIRKFETALLTSSHKPSVYTENLLATLNKLSAIQLEESKAIMKEVEAQYATIKASAQFAFAIVIIILVVLQIMVFSGESLIAVVKTKDPRLN